MALIALVPNPSCRDVIDLAFKNIDRDIACEIHNSNNIVLKDPENNDLSHSFSLPVKISDLIIKSAEMLRLKNKYPDHIQVGNADFFPEKNLFKNEKNEISLTEKEVSILIELWRAIPSSVSKGHLLKTVWGYQNELETHTLETHIYRLRQKIENNPAAPKILITEADGYKLNVS